MELSLGNPAISGPMDAPVALPVPAGAFVRPPRPLIDTDQLGTIVARFASAGQLWRAHVRHDPAARRYVRLAWTPDYEVWLICWGHGHEIDLHDHGGSAGAFIVTEGALSEDYLDRGVVRHRRCGRGVVRSFSVNHLHTVSNPGPALATSLHAYSPPLRSMTFYAQHDGAGPEATHVEIVQNREWP